MSPQLLTSLKSLRGLRDGERVSFRARVLRLWEVGGLRMCLAGDDSALTRVELGEEDVHEDRSYEFRNAIVLEYPGGWHSAALDEASSVAPIESRVEIAQDEAYIERTYKILSGVQRKKGRAAGRLPPWRHPASKGREGEGKRL